MSFTLEVIAITRKSETATFQINNTSGYVNWLAQTWYTSPGDPGRVIESFELIFTGTDLDIRTNVELLGALRSEVDRYFVDSALSESIWFSITESEFYTRRALIYSIEFAPINRGQSSQALGGTGSMFYTVTIERDEVWENVYPTTASNASVATFGGVWALGGTIGKLGARFEEVKFSCGTSIVSPNYLNKLWIGCQQYYGTLGSAAITSGFSSNMRAARDTPTIGSVVSSAAYYSGSGLSLGTVPAALSELTTLSLANHSGTLYNYYMGKWLLLAHARANSGVVGLQLRWGRTNSFVKTYDTRNYCETIYVSGTTFQYYELGNVTWPSIPNYGGTISLNGEKLDIEIQQISGTTTLFEMDAITLIPASHIVRVTSIVAQNVVPRLKLWVFEDGKTLAYNDDNTGQSQFMDWHYPKENGFLVIAGQGVGTATLAGTLQIDLSYVTQYSYFIP